MAPEILKLLPEKTWTCDIETLISCFTATFINVHTLEEQQFVLWMFEDQTVAMDAFIRERVECLVGFNSVSFDDQVLAMICSSAGSLKGTKLLNKIYTRAQEIIGDEPSAKQYVPWIQIDLFLMYHFNNIAKMISLKWLQCHLKMENIADMPYPHDYIVKDRSEVDNILTYNRNDVMATLKLLFQQETLDKVKLRFDMTTQLNMTSREIINLADASIGERLLTNRMTATDFVVNDKIRISNLILPNIRFKTKEMNEILDEFKATVIDVKNGKIHSKKMIYDLSVDIDDKFKPSTILDGMRYDFGLGGVHAARVGFFTNIFTVDVKSYYPNLAIVNRWSPAGYGDEFVDLYRSIYEERSKYPSKTSMNLILKLALNAVFGKSNSEHSALYDPTFTYRITVNGQLLLAMLCEAITIREAGKVIMANTDGIEIDVRPGRIAEVTKIMDAWKKMTGLPLEDDWYNKIAIRDCNNYIAISDKGRVKEKGAYETASEVYNERKDFHKDPSAVVVPKAVREWLVNGVTPLDYLKQQTDIDDFLIYVRAKTGSMKALRYDGTEVPVPKTLRYYVLRKGKKRVGFVLKQKTEKQSRRIHSHYTVALFNKWEDAKIEHYDIGYDYYLGQINDLINPFEAKEELALL